MQTVVRKAEQDMKRVIDATLKNFNGVRTGRASIALVEGIHVDYHGSMTPLNQLASLAVPERRLVPATWDPRRCRPSKAILKSSHSPPTTAR
jgi:ribosome recycling factor